MKKLFVYFSLTGNGDLVSSVYKEKGFEIRKVESKKKYSKKMFPLMMKGYHSVCHRTDSVYIIRHNLCQLNRHSDHAGSFGHNIIFVQVIRILRNSNSYCSLSGDMVYQYS